MNYLENKNNISFKKQNKILTIILVIAIITSILFVFFCPSAFRKAIMTLPLPNFAIEQINSSAPISAPSNSPQKMVDLFNHLNTEYENYQPYSQSRYCDWFGLNRNSAWCAIFVSHAAMSSDNSDTIVFSARCTTQMLQYNKIGRLFFSEWIEHSNKKNDIIDYLYNDFKEIESDATSITPKFSSPQIGDLVYFNYGEISSRLIDHVGFVVDIRKNINGKITHIITLEGNSNNLMKKHSYKVNSKSIIAYGRPDYAQKDEKAKKTITSWNKSLNLANTNT